MKKYIKYMRYGLEAVILLPGLLFFRILPLDIASAVGGFLSRFIGPMLGVHHVADKNLSLAMPELTEPERRKILYDMWDNLGRVIGEYPHLTRKIMAKRIVVEGREYLEKIKTSGKGSLFVSGHFANWEIVPLTASLCKLPIVLIYRAANNPVSDWIINRIRSSYNLRMHNKGREAALHSLKALKENQAIGMLVDQKMNTGSPVPFFGRDAMTATAATSMAIKYQVPLLLARVVRTGGVHFHVSLQPPITYEPSADPVQAMADIHKTFEDWIRAYPAQWFWVHRRWGK
jgi:KDO2-lipid IV(A) lauroyltransferase